MDINNLTLPSLKDLRDRKRIELSELIRSRINSEGIGGILSEVGREVMGLDRVIIKSIAALSVGRHILFLGPIGSGKTTLALTIAESLRLNNSDPYIRVDSHPDITASDLVGDIDIVAAKTFGIDHPLAIIHGPALLSHGKIFIIDEINRMTPQAQASLLQILQEGKTYIRGFPIIVSTLVIATANPTEFLGTFEISEALKDRMMVIPIDIPDHEILKVILKIKSNKVMDRDIPDEFIRITAIIIDRLHKDKRIYVGSSIRGGIYAISTALAMGEMEGVEPTLDHLEDALVDNLSSIMDGDFDGEYEKREFIRGIFKSTIMESP